MRMPMVQRIMRWCSALLAAVVLAVQLLEPYAAARAIPVEVTADVPGTVVEVKRTILQSLQAAALGSLISGASYFARKLAYDTAVAIASAGSGQKPLAILKTPGKYFRDVASDSVGTMIEELGKPFGLNLCQVPDARFGLYLQIGFRKLYPEFGGNGPQKPKCNLGKFISNWKKAPGMYGSSDALLSRFNANLSVKESDFGVALGGIAAVDNAVARASNNSAIEQLVGNGFKPLQSLISGNIKSPAATVKNESEVVSAKQQGEQAQGQISGIYAAQAAQILPMAGSVFLNTLTGQLLDRALKKGLFADRPGNDTQSTAGGGYGGYDGGTFTDNRQAAQQAFNFLFTAAPTKQLNSYDIISEFASCPDNPGLNNCVIDTKLQGLLASRSDKMFTIAEAIEQGYLDKNKPLISARREFDNTDVKNCYLRGYCYSNIQKLRKVRILPLGFEIAAQNSDPDEPWKLGDVVKGFEDCRRDSLGNVVPDPRKPFCHLIDPNWIIKAPEARCEAKVFGPERADNSSPVRKEECVDISTCLSEGPNGECLGSYGYCTKEKNVWRLGGEECKPYAATCKTYLNETTGALASYLARTLDYGQCTADVVGCRAFSTDQNAAGEWTASAAPLNVAKKRLGQPQAIYFNQVINDSSTVCTDAANGCTAFGTAVRNASTGQFVTTTNNQFVRNRGSDGLVYLKKAPDYLGCYDANPGGAIDWPQNELDIAKMTPPKDACKPFAQACIPSEIGCDEFKPGDGGPTIPGVVGGNSCPLACVGYDAYRQEATKFSPVEYPVYFVASAGKSCTQAQVGCEEFTNIESAAQGGEQREYYTDLRYCEKPAEDNQKVYYTWEGSTAQGFVLKVHRLRVIDAAINGVIASAAPGVVAAYPVGSPAYYDFTPDGLTKRAADCNATTYNERLANPSSLTAAPTDCRAFYDDAGTISYRLLGDIISVSDQCRKLRKTEPRLVAASNIPNRICESAVIGGHLEGNTCQVCYNGGHYESGSCVYHTIPAEATSCTAEVNGCRAYTGNAVNNMVAVIPGDEFEPKGTSQEAVAAALAGWSSGQIAAEATQVGLHSLEVSGDTHRTIPAGVLKNGHSYELSFWSRGNPQTLHIYFAQGSDNKGDFTFDFVSRSPSYVSVGQSWRRYTLGLVEFTGDDTEVALRFVRQPGSSGTYFLDNVRVTEVKDTLNVVKGSWKRNGLDVPAACDSNPSDGLPGEMLGCKEYKNLANDTVYATGFERLCRKEAVGCQPVYDTHNTISTANAEQAQAFNVWCAGPAEQACTIALGTEVATCTVLRGETGCYIPRVVIPNGEVLPDANIRPSTVIVPADTPDAAPLFLTVAKEYLCDESQKGCMKTGVEQQDLPDSTNVASYSHTAANIKNDPDLYVSNAGNKAGTLCRSDVVGCGEFSSGNTKSYFRDPALSGKLCTYKPKSDGTSEYGWFMSGVGTCSNAPHGQCRTAADCGTGNTCENIGNVACYPDNLARGGEYGIWSNKTGDNRYTGMVGVCSQEQNQCTELRDINNRANDPAGEPYYVIYDEKVTQRAGECEGKVSLKDGCVLFDKTDVPNKSYNAVQTYNASKLVQDGPVTPVIGVEPLDANVILKVDRDRTCAEWLACKSTIQHVDDRGGTTSLCYQYAACKGTTPGLSCTDWVSKATVSNPLEDRLSDTVYTARNTRWDGVEYSGYSMFNKYQMNDLIYLSLRNSSDQNVSAASYAVYQVKDRFFVDQYKDRGCNGATVIDPATRRPRGKKDWDVCGFDDGGRCVESKCVYPVTGKFSAGVDTDAEGIAELEGGSCKGYPEADSPYLRSVAASEALRIPLPANGMDVHTKFTTLKPSFSGVNVCQDDGPTRRCSCNYEKIIYKNGVVDYWPVQKKPTKAGVCSGGAAERAKKMCDVDTDCVVEGVVETPGISTCQLVEKSEQHVGLEGYCLERDFSRPVSGEPGKFTCLTWLPIDVSVSGADVYNSYPEAGYQGGTAEAPWGQVYCVESGGGSKDIVLDWRKTTLGKTANVVRPADYNCSDLRLTDFQSQICQAGVSSDLREQMEHWSNGDDGFGTGRTALLRIETGNRSDGQSYGFVPYDYHPDDEDLSGILNYTMYHLAPMMGHDQEGMLLADGTELKLSGDNVSGLDSGVIMHPPRRWGGDYSQKRLETYEIATTPYYFSMGATQGKQSTIPLSPGPYLFDLNQKNTAGADGLDNNFMVYRTAAELGLKDTELENVYFVPIGFPGGADGFVPPLFTKQLALNIGELQRGPLSIRKAVDVFVGGGDRGVYFPNLLRRGNVTSGGAMVWTYMLQRPEGESGNDFLLSALGGNEYSGEGSLAALKNERKNIIQRRYVMVFAKPGNGIFGSVTDGATMPTMDRSPFDAFSVNCVGGYQEDWFAVGMDFNADNEFIGYISRFCNGSSGDATRPDVSMQLAVYAEYKDQCREFVLVQNNRADQIQGDINKAWTQRLWEKDQYQGWSKPLGGTLDRLFIQKYFGSLTIDGARFGNSTLLSSYYFVGPVSTPLANGVPYGGTVDNPAYSASSLDFNEPTDLGYWGGDDLRSSRRPYTDLQGLFAKIYRVGRNISRDYPAADSSSGATKMPLDASGRQSIEYYDNPSDVGVLDTSFTSAIYAKLLPPQIYSLNPATCYSSGSSNGNTEQHCTVGEKDNVTISGKNGTITDYNKDNRPDEDTNFDNIPDAIIRTDNFQAVMHFFAFTDDNKMPLRRVKVDWNDGSEIVNRQTTGLYKNRKPYCGETADVGVCQSGSGNTAVLSGVTCKANSDCPASAPTCNLSTGPRFGNSTNACQEGYFEFVHEYTCDENTATTPVAQLGADARNRLLGKGLSDTDKVCVFQPRVQVLDNWGWCNGNCSWRDPADGATRSIALSNGGFGGCWNKESANPDERVLSCEDNSPERGTSWTRSRGTIIVVPTKK